MGLPNAPTAYTDVRRRWRVPVRHSAASAAWRRPRLPQWSWAAAWAIGHMRTTGRPWRAERACRRPPIWTGPPKSVGICSARTRQSRQDPRASYRSTGTCSRPSSTAWSARPSSIIQIDRSLTAKAGRLGLKVPKLKGEVFRIRGHRAPQTARGKRRPAAISTGPGSMTNSRKRTDHRAMDGHGPKCTSFRALPRKSQLYRGY